jgi:peptide/nickel transport system substrate-binding protein
MLLGFSLANYEGVHVKRKDAWWDKLGNPQYGGEMIIRANRNIVNFDPYFTEGLTSIYGGWMERLVADDWTLDPATWDYIIAWRPSKYQKGLLAESWEFPEPGTHVVHLRKGVHWQNIAPANGREFVADDVVFHYNRLFALGGGFTKPSPFRVADIRFQDLISVNVADKYTVVFKFRISNEESIIETLHSISQAQCLENPDAIKKWGDVSDWHHAIGTGPFILQDFIPNKSAVLVRNPDYWGYDERHPQNKLPYIDKLKFIIIPDEDEAIEAMRAGKIDIIPQVSSEQALTVQKTNPEMIRVSVTGDPTSTIQLRNDVSPFSDIRVRKALQMAIDLPGIAKSYYNGTVDPHPSTLTNREMKGWGFPYEDWPQDLKDEYSYNPKKAKNLLIEAGYPNGFKTNVLADSNGDMKLLQIIKSYFGDVGINMEIRTMETHEWVNFVEIEHKHDQMVYRSYGPLGHTKAPLRVITQFHTGYTANFNMINDCVFDSFYPRAVAATSEDELKQVLRDANERVARQHFVVSLLQPKAYSLCQPWLKGGYNGQAHSIWNGSGGPSMLSFYGARLWIDQSLKKRMGH